MATPGARRMLVVDDEPAVLELFERVFTEQGWEVLGRPAADGLPDALPDSLRGGGPKVDLAVVDVLLPRGSGIELCARLSADHGVPVIALTTRSKTGAAIEAMRAGALDFLLHPLDVLELRRLVERGSAPRPLLQGPAVEVTPGEEWFVGESAPMQRLYRAIGRVATLDIPVLVLGETGTGKELVARALHHYGRRRGRPFLAVNCAAIPEHLLESELFGHERGAFTGADRRHRGLLEQCAGGTLFLDEIGDMELRLQSKLLRTLEDGSFRRLGSEETHRADVRVVAATHRDLEAWVERGEFRQDLYWRLNGFTLRVPALRERGEDLELLIDVFRCRANDDFRRRVVGVAPEAMACLHAHRWPGNVRELERVVRQAVLQSIGERIEVDALPDHLQPAGAPLAHDLEDGDEDFVQERLNADSQSLYDEVVARVERRLFHRVLDAKQGNLSAAARTLGLSRTTLRAKLRSLGIAIDREGHAVDELSGA